MCECQSGFTKKSGDMSTDRRIGDDIFGDVAKKSTGIRTGAKKGKDNERLLAATLGKWVGTKFNRTPQSGGMHLRNANFAGDIVCVDQKYDFPFTVETKHLKTIYVPDSGNLRTNSIVYTIFDQARKDAERVGLSPLAFLRSNGMDRGEYWLVTWAYLPGGPAYVASGWRRADYRLYVYRFSEVAKRWTWPIFRDLVRKLDHNGNYTR